MDVNRSARVSNETVSLLPSLKAALQPGQSPRARSSRQCAVIIPAVRTNPLFETGSKEHGWLNDIVCVGRGYVVERGVAYKVAQVI
jgi:hypothetical protein